MRDDRERLLDIQEAIERIEKYAVRGHKAYERNELIQTWVLHHLQIIGEAVRSLSPELVQKHSEIAWSKIVGMRNILVHNYFSIDAAIVWAVIENDLPVLKQQINELLDG